MKPNLAADRIIGHFDCDCFEVQIFQLENPESRGQPCVVANKLGRIVSVSYEARALGISRNIRLEEAKAKCRTGAPDLELIVFLNDAASGRAKDSRLRETGNCIKKTVQNFISSSFAGSVRLEFLGNDEFWLDLTEAVNEKISANILINEQSTSGLSLHFEGEDGKIRGTLTEFLPFADKEETVLKLIHGAQIGVELIQIILEKTGIQVSAGIGTNKLNSKLAGALNKPAALTIIPPCGIVQMSTKIRIDTIPGLKGKLGDKIAELLNVETMHQLSLVTEQALLEKGFEIKEIRQIRQFSQGECKERVNSCIMTNGLKFSRKFSESSNNTIAEGSLESVLEDICEGFWERAEEEEIFNKRKLKSGSVSIKRESRSLNVPFDLNTCDSGRDIFQQIMPLFKNSAEPKLEPWSTVLQITFNGKKFTKC